MFKNKRVLYLLLIALVGLFLYGCEEFHTHSYGTEWVTSETHHWHQCICTAKQDEAEHTFSEWEIITEPTATEKGKESRKCTVCEYTEEKDIPAVEHKHNYTQEVIAPTCDKDGYTLHTCECGDSFQDTVVKALGHEYGEDGKCIRCGVSEDGVKYTYELSINDENGKLASKCVFELSVDGTCKGTYYILNESGEFVLDEEAEFYWTEENKTIKLYSDKELKTCFAKLIVNEDGSLTPYICEVHNFDESLIDPILAPTCTKEGLTILICTECGATDTKVLPALGHEYGEDGECIRCGEKENSEVKAEYTLYQEYKNGEIVFTKVKYDFFSDGTVVGTVSTMNENGEYVEQVVNAFWKLEDNCVVMCQDEALTYVIGRCTINEDKSLTIYTCEEHKLDSERKEPTCTEPGYETQHCSVCGYMKQSYLNPLGHEYNENGECGRCGEGTSKVLYTYTDEYVNDSGIVEDKMTLEFLEGGLLVAKLYGLNENNELVLYQEMTAYWKEENGYALLYEDNKFESYMGKYILNEDGTAEPFVCVDHVWEEVYNEPTCTEEGMKGQQCIECGYGHASSIPALGHEYGEDGTCIRCGIEQGEDPLADLRKETIQKIDEIWRDVTSQYEVYDEDWEEYKYFTSFVNKANSIEEIYDALNEFNIFIQSIMERGEPQDKEVVYYYYQDEINPDGGMIVRVSFEFYSDNTAMLSFIIIIVETKEEQVFMEQPCYWTIRIVNGDEIICLYETPEFTNSGGAFIVNEDNILEPYECTEHLYEDVYDAPTCTEDGYDGHKCIICAEGDFVLVPALGHEYDEDGTCIRCGAKESEIAEELLNYKKQILEKMNYEWKEVVSNYQVSEEYYYRFEEYCKQLDSAASYDEIEKIIYEFQIMIDEIRNSHGSDEEYIINIYLECDYYEVMQGTDIDHFIDENIVGKSIIVEYNLSGMQKVEITRDMLEFDYIDTNEVGYYEIYVVYANEYLNTRLCIDLDVIVDMSQANIVGVYTTDESYGMPMQITLYDNGIAESEGEYMPYSLEGDILVLESYGVTLYYTLNEEAKTIINYQPEGEAIKKLIYDEVIIIIEFAFYGEYNGAGEYFAVVTQTVNMGEGNVMVVPMTTIAYLNLEEQYIYSNMFESEMVFDEEGKLSRKECEHDFVINIIEATCTSSGYEEHMCIKCGIGSTTIIPPLPHELVDGVCVNCGQKVENEYEDIEKHREEVLYRFDELYRSVEENYDLTDEHYVVFDRLHNNVSIARTTIIIDLYEELFEEFIDFIQGNEELDFEFKYCQLDVLAMMDEEWTYLSYECMMTEEHNYRYQNLLKDVRYAGCLEDIEKFVEQYYMLVEEVRSNVEDKVYIQYIKLNTYSYDIPQGTDLREYISKNIVGDVFFVYYSDGSEIEQVIEWSMIEYEEFDTSEIQTNYIYLVYTDQYNSYSEVIQLRVVINLENATMIGKYQTVEGEYPSLLVVELYDNGYLIRDAGYDQMQCPYTLENGILTFSVYGMKYLFKVNEEDATLRLYVPSEELILTARYSENSYYVEFKVYGNYVGAGEYVAVVEECEIYADGEREAYFMTTTVYIDMEKSYFYSVGFDCDMYFDEEGNLYYKECEHEYLVKVIEATCQEEGSVYYYCDKCGDSYYDYTAKLPHEYDEEGNCINCGVSSENSDDNSELENYRNQVLKEMDYDWEKILSQFEISEDGYANYQKTYDMVTKATSIEEIEQYYNDYKQLITSIYNGKFVL